METTRTHLIQLLGDDQAVLPLVETLTGTAAIHEIDGGSRLFASGDVCAHFVLVVSGTARVQISTRTGRSVTLFRLVAGETCALTTSCLLSETSYFAEGIAETDMQIMMIPAAVFRAALTKSPGLMSGLLTDYARRIASLTALVDRLTSRDLEAELKTLLHDNCDDEGWLNMSHQDIAIELGTAREVVSRRLKELERAGHVRLGRGRLRLLAATQ